jgi:hypothetical protein
MEGVVDQNERRAAVRNLDSSDHGLAERSKSEEADDYHAVVVKINDNWRVIVCVAGLQWILQRRAGERHGSARWEGRSFCRTSEALNRLSRKRAGIIGAAASAVLAALPDWIEAPNRPITSLGRTTGRNLS